MVWNMYSLLTPIRYVLNPRFHLTTPLQSGLLYIAPGAGYVIGCQIGGRWADYTVSSWIRKRGIRLPEDRLRSSLIFLGLMLPASMVLYGWTLDKKFGGIPLPIICMFLQGIAQLAAFPSLNAYILDVMQQQNGEASGKLYACFWTTRITMTLTSSQPATTSCDICAQALQLRCAFL